jgi:diaminohydroxyphosphoribosylaminopyrimidine deaminase/5-amino-6-(5-phosphoribosylamino)uracil reductase
MKNSASENLLTASDRHFLRLALTLAQNGRGTCQPNPMVGAVLVGPDGKILGRGYHVQAGQGHAEVNALADAVAKGLSPKGATLYVTLEPCSTQGRTPPCTDAIIKAGISRVVIGCLDDNPRHAGRGVTILRQAGLQVQVAEGLLADDCRRLNEAFFWWIRHRRPFVCLKMAMTLDGKIALPNGDSKWITGPNALRHVQELRQQAGAIMVGGRTAIIDNPALTVRPPLTVLRQPRRFLWTSRKLPAGLQMMQGDNPAQCVNPRTQAEWLAFLRRLGREDCNFLLLEGGGELAAAALQAGIVNKVEFFVAPKLMLGRDSVPVTGGVAVPSLAEALPISNLKAKRIGSDYLLTGYCDNVYRLD